LGYRWEVVVRLTLAIHVLAITMLAGVVYAAPVSSPRVVAHASGASVPTYNIEATCRQMASVPEARPFDSNAPDASPVIAGIPQALESNLRLRLHGQKREAG
jgi:hypothetical protein